MIAWGAKDLYPLLAGGMETGSRNRKFPYLTTPSTMHRRAATLAGRGGEKDICIERFLVGYTTTVLTNL
jgi:hypothetical protein